MINMINMVLQKNKQSQLEEKTMLHTCKYN